MLNLIEDSRSNHVEEMSKHFNALLDDSNNASTITMDNHKAKGFISSYKIFDGLSVWVYNITFLSDFKVDLGLSENSPYYFCYNVKGHFFHRFGDQEKFADILQNQNMIVIGSPENSVQIIFPANTELKIAIIIVDIKLLGSLDIRNAKRIHSNVGKIFQKIPKFRPYRYHGGIDTETEKYASIVCENKDIDLVEGLLTEGAVLNMLASQIKSYSKDINDITPQSTLSKSELSKITSLGAYVIDNFETNLTILKLSKHFGMSPKKLQKGVRYLYGDSVGHYISNLRMGHAKHLLSTTDLNVSEVCFRVGISSRSYFSKVFKNRYGKLPSQYIN
ncbi:MAG: AraC-like DNA-binding protein [Paraglaciecola sp.]|jgi:AraC-like DNA-binding protein